MPIAFTRMKQFESQGKQLHGVASGAAAASVMTGGLKDLMKTTGTVIKSPPNHDLRALPIRNRQPPDFTTEIEVDFPIFEFKGHEEMPTWHS